MAQKDKVMITIDSVVKVPIDKVWKYWTQTEHVVNWNAASDDWHTTFAENDFKVGGKFNYRMEAKDGSFGFDFWGIYDEIQEYKVISNTLGDGRRMKVSFNSNGQETTIVEMFEAEDENPIEMQKFGWQSILDNFKKYAEEI